MADQRLIYAFAMAGLLAATCLGLPNHGLLASHRDVSPDECVAVITHNDFCSKDCSSRINCGSGFPVVVQDCTEQGLFCYKSDTLLACNRVNQCGGPIWCYQDGVFPDPDNCQIYHTCAGEKTMSTPATCEDSAFDLSTHACGLPLDDVTCQGEGPVPDCMLAQQRGALDANPVHYYRCQLLDRVLYPEQYRCQEGEQFDTILSRCVPATTTVPTESTTATTETTTATTETTTLPTETPTSETTTLPTETPTSETTTLPTETPTSETTTLPTETPTSETTTLPTETPTSETTTLPTETPTSETTTLPTETPTSETTTLPTEAASTQTFPTEATTFPTEATTFPTESTTFPTETTTFPTEASTFPTEATTFPTEGTTFSTEATTFPTEATTFPTESTTFPTESTTFPTESTTSPTEATTFPTEATTFPTEATTFPTEAMNS